MFKTMGDPKLEAMLIAGATFLRDVAARARPRWLSFLGGSGTGKTFLADQIYGQMRGVPHVYNHHTLKCGVLRAFWPRLLTQLRNQEYHRIEDLSDANLVVIDEIAVEHDPTGFARDKLHELLTRRVQKWTIVTSNLSMKSLDDIDTRISSRLIRDGSEVVRCDTLDFSLR